MMRNAADSGAASRPQPQRVVNNWIGFRSAQATYPIVRAAVTRVRTAMYGRRLRRKMFAATSLTANDPAAMASSHRSEPAQGTGTTGTGIEPTSYNDDPPLILVAEEAPR